MQPGLLIAGALWANLTSLQTRTVQAGMTPSVKHNSAIEKSRWLDLAREALAGWGIQSYSLRWLGYGSKATLKIECDSGCYALRLQHGGRQDEAHLRSEMRWLRLIREQAGLEAPVPVPVLGAERDQCVYALSTPLRPPQRRLYAMLFEFIEGDIKPARDLRRDDLVRVGTYLARLRRDAQFKPPPAFIRPRLDNEGLFGADSPYYSDAEGGGLSAAQRATFAAVAERVGETMTRLGEDKRNLGMIHADMLAKNIVIRSGSIAALDFEFCGWGYFLYDLAPLLWQLKGERADDYPELESALWSGYRAINDSVSDHRDCLEAFIAARQLASCRWLLANLSVPALRAAAPTLITQRCNELRDYLDTGLLRRKSATL